MKLDRASLAAGYLLAVPVLMRFNRMVRTRNLAMLATLEVGQALIAAGWMIRGRRLRAAVNAAALVGYPLWYALDRGR